jgi:hypothetical protein
MFSAIFFGSASSLPAQAAFDLVSPNTERAEPIQLAQLPTDLNQAPSESSQLNLDASTLAWRNIGEEEVDILAESGAIESIDLELPNTSEPASRVPLPDIPELEWAPASPTPSTETAPATPQLLSPSPGPLLLTPPPSPPSTEIISSSPAEPLTGETQELEIREVSPELEWTVPEVVHEEEPAVEEPTNSGSDLISRITEAPIEETPEETSSGNDLMSRLIEAPLEGAPEETSSGNDLMSRLVEAPLEGGESTPHDSLTPVSNSTNLAELYHSQQISDLLKEAAAMEQLADWAETAQSHINRLEAALATSLSVPDISGEASMNENADSGYSTTLQEVEFWIVKLEQSVQDAGELFPEISDFSTACVLQRTRFALMRRLPIWSRITSNPNIAVEEIGTVLASNDEALKLSLAEVKVLLTPAAGEKWKKYLLITQLSTFLDRTVPEPPLSNDVQEHLIQMRRALFSEVIGRIDNPELKPEQRVFLEQPIFIALRGAILNTWPRRATPLRILSDLERYERTLAPADAQRLAIHVHELQLSVWESDRRFAAEIDQFYRNSNMRFSVSEDLLNRLMPPRPREYQRFRDRIAGKSVEGHRWTDSQVAFRLLPDPARLSLALDVEGVVTSATESQSMGATFENQSRSSYIGAKYLTFDEHGLHFAPAQVAVNDNRLQLRSVTTAFDPIPLLGYIANEVAISEHQRLRPMLDEEMRQKIYDEAKEQIDDESNARLQTLNERIISRGLDPMHGMAVGPTVISHETTETELRGRWLIASTDQLGGHTPRPSPPPGSLASVQIHETLINNLLDQLDLAGTEYAIAELREHLAGRLNRPEWAGTTTDNDDVRIAFAQENPVRVSFQDGRMELHLNIARLQREGQSWQRFQVKVRYTAEADGLGIALQRDGVVELGGVSGAQIALRGIFGSVFSDEDEPSFTSDVLMEDPRFRGLYLNQCFIDDGWIGLAIGATSRPFIAIRP